MNIKRALISLAVGAVAAALIVGIMIGMTALLLYVEPGPVLFACIAFFALSALFAICFYFDKNVKM